MKEIKITKLSLRNFKGCAALDLDLEGKNASIYGDNAVGKTTVYDALTWLLFGKDSRGSADQELIKPLDKDGSVKDHEAVTCVEAELTVCGDDGAHCAPLQLRKEMQEAWVTRRGSSQPVYDGNEFRYFLDGVPLKKNEYTRRVGELVEEDVFKMLTSVTAFAQDMPWKKRREILYDMSGVSQLSDRALMQQMAKEDGRQIAGATDSVDAETLEELMELLSGKTLEDLRKVLAARRKALMGTRSQTPARLDELNRQAAPLEAQDYGAAEQAKAAAEAELEKTRTAAARITAEQQAGRQRREARAGATEAERKLAELEAERKAENAKLAEQRSEVKQKIAGLETELDKWSCERSRALDQAAMDLQKLESDNSMFRWKQEKDLPDLKALNRKVNELQTDAARLEQSAALHEKDAKTQEAMLERDRQEWLAVNAESFGGAKCPTCGQELPMDQMQKARDSFEANKVKRLNGIQSSAEIHKMQAENNRGYAKQDRERLENVNLALDQAVADLMEAEKVPTEIRDMEGYREQKEALEARLEELKGIQVMPGYREKRDALSAELAAVPAEWPEYPGKRAVIEAEIRNEQDAADRKRLEAEQDLAALGGMASDLKRKIEQADGILRGRETLNGLRRRMEELRQEQKRTAAELEQVDRMAFGLEEYIRWKTRFIENSVNGLFRIVTFRLFKELISGGLEECCDVVVDGVPYNALNNGARVNAGMDIIRRLAEHYGVRVPLIVDNAEGVTRLEDAGTQVIRLVVSEQDKALRVEI